MNNTLPSLNSAIQLLRKAAYGKHVFFSLMALLAIGMLNGCSTTYIPIETDEAYRSYEGKGLTIAKEGISLSLLPCKNPRGLNSNVTTFELVAENRTQERQRLMLSEILLFSSRGEQFRPLEPTELPAMIVRTRYEPVFVWHTSRWGHHYRHGGIIHVPVTDVQPTGLREKGFSMADTTIYPDAMIRGYLYFPCNDYELYSVRVLITRLIEDPERPKTRKIENGLEITETPVLEVPYEFEFRLKHD